MIKDSLFTNDNEKADAIIKSPVTSRITIEAAGGCGKSRTIVQRIKHLRDDKNIPLHQIVVLSFSNIAVDNIKDKMRKEDIPFCETGGIFDELNKVPVVTIHSFLWQFLKMTMGEYPKVITPELIYKLIEEFMNKQCKSEDDEEDSDVSDISNEYIKSICDRISFTRNKGLDLEKELRKIDRIYGGRYNSIKAYKDYKVWKESEGNVDFADMITEFRPDMIKRCGFSMKYLIVDEFQDSPNVQQESIRNIIDEIECGALLSYDCAQSVFGFLGTRIENLNPDTGIFRDFDSYTYTTNYRSPQNIIDFSFDIIKNNTHKYPKSVANNGLTGDKIEVIYCSNEIEEAKYVCRAIEPCIRAGKTITILSRTNNTNNAIIYQLNHSGYKYNNTLSLKTSKIGCRRHLSNLKYIASIFNTALLFNSKDYEEIIESFKDHNYPCSYPDFKAKYYTHLYSFLKYHKISMNEDAFEKALSKSSKIYQLFDILIIKNAALRESLIFPKSDTPALSVNEILSAYCDKYFTPMLKSEYRYSHHISMQIDNYIQSITDNYESDEKAEEEDVKVRISTIHSYKGMEADIVFVLDVVNGNIPNRSALLPDESTGNLQEERNLLSIACLRAKEKLYIMVPNRYYDNRRAYLVAPSTFLQGIDHSTFIERTYSEQ